MRISDWSSDVCSSDLLVYLAASGEAAGQLDTMLARAADYLEREFDAFTSTALAMLEPIIIILMGCIVAVIILRSEEHTSELQSLMRISYAVFCLKKKTKTKEYQTMKHYYIKTK